MPALPAAVPGVASVPPPVAAGLASPGSAAVAPAAGNAPQPTSPGDRAGVPAVVGSPDAGAQTGRDVATPPSQAASTPRLNLDLAKPRAGPGFVQDIWTFCAAS